MAQTLLSIEAQNLPLSVQVQIFVADNDEEPSAKSLVKRTASKMDVPITYIHAPARNISLARNACLAQAQGDWLAFIDDDEVADPNWLARLLDHALGLEPETVKRSEPILTPPLSAVFGPAIAVYGEGAPAWIRARDYHSNWPQRRRGVVETGHTCNALVCRTDPAVMGKVFDLGKGLSGGEDTDYFFRIGKDGGNFGICSDAQVKEAVDPARLDFRWIAERKFRSGQSFMEGAGGQSITRRGGLAIAAVLKGVFCGLVAGLFFWSTASRNFWILRAWFHVGVVAGFFKVKQKELY